MNKYTTIDMKWFSLEFTPLDGQKIVVLWRRSEQSMMEYNFRTYRSWLKYPFGIHTATGKVIGWIPLPGVNDIFVTK
jgi:hypothetical protein